jgi:hypothetical protein
MNDAIHMTPENKLKINQQKFFYSNKIAYLYIVMNEQVIMTPEKKSENKSLKVFLCQKDCLSLHSNK